MGYVQNGPSLDDFKICPYCDTDYSDVPNETSKLYNPLYTGRSTPVDVLTISALNSFAANQQKMLLFTDNRQDSAFQSAHLNDFYQKVMIRHAIFAIIKEQQELKEPVTLKNIGKLMHQRFSAMGIDFLARSDRVDSRPTSEINELYLHYYTFVALSDNLLGTYRLNPNLERLGLIDMAYDKFEEFVADPAWKNPSLFFTEYAGNPESNFLDSNTEQILQKFDSELIYDLGLTILNFIRSRGVVDHDLLNNTKTYWADWIKNLNQKAIFDNPYFRFKDKNHYFTDEEDFDADKLLLESTVDAMQIFSQTSSIFKTTRKLLSDSDLLRDFRTTCSKEQWDSICLMIHRFFVNMLYIKEYINSETLHGKGQIKYTVYQLNPSKFLHILAPESVECPKCKRLYHFKNHTYCVQARCKSLLKPIDTEPNFFKQLYTQSHILTHPLISAEHTAQIDLSERTDIEDSFEEHTPGAVNVIVCTPTMELGVDIGNLPLVLLRNVPPTSSSYAQRAGRAGRDQSQQIPPSCDFEEIVQAELAIPELGKIFTIFGSIDCITKQSIYEFKCVDELTDVHRLQLALYAYLYKQTAKKAKKVQCLLWNILTNEMIEIHSSRKQLEAMVQYLIVKKNEKISTLSDAAFLVKQQEIIRLYLV